MEVNAAATPEQVAPPPLEELEVLFPKSKEVKVTGSDGTEFLLHIMPMTIKQSAIALKAFRRITAESEVGDLSVQQFIVRYPDEVIEIVAAALSPRPQSFYESLPAHEGIRVALAVFEVNLPFFVDVIAPLFAESVARAVLRMMLLTGAANSNG
jgi:hypothetical protein